MRTCDLIYKDVLEQKRIRNHPMTGALNYFANRGARVQSPFVEPVLKSSNGIFRNILEITKAGRIQEFEKMTVQFVSEDAKKLHGSFGALGSVQRVIVEWLPSASEFETMQIIFPDRVYFECAIWEPKTRTNVHDYYLDADERSLLAQEFETVYTNLRRNMGDEMRSTLSKAVELDKWLENIGEEDFF
jgi:hypothetical protein